MRTLLCVMMLASCMVGDEVTDDDLDDVPPDDPGISALATTFVPASTFNKRGLSHSGTHHSGIEITSIVGGSTLQVYDSYHRPLATAALDDGPNMAHLEISTLEKIVLDGV